MRGMVNKINLTPQDVRDIVTIIVTTVDQAKKLKVNPGIYLRYRLGFSHIKILDSALHLWNGLVIDICTLIGEARLRSFIEMPHMGIPNMDIRNVQLVNLFTPNMIKCRPPISFRNRLKLFFIFSLLLFLLSFKIPIRQKINENDRPEFIQYKELKYQREVENFKIQIRFILYILFVILKIIALIVILIFLFVSFIASLERLFLIVG